ncbi:hypothetical protein DBR32_00550 [Taibaiella sp. KBW10]|nr:hypothetical protein DBR32_00550 [Taibaiella sp. KBW10]
MPCTCRQNGFTNALPQHNTIAALQNEINTIYGNLRERVRPLSVWDLSLLEKEFTTIEKRAFRGQMKTGRDRTSTGSWYEDCKKKNGKCELHHIIPLQYTHLFKKNLNPQSNSKHHPNHVNNLVLVGQKPHDQIHAIVNKHLWPIYEKYGVPKNKSLANAILVIPTLEKRNAFQRELKAALQKAKAETLAYVKKNHVNAFVPAGFKGSILKEIMEQN